MAAGCGESVSFSLLHNYVLTAFVEYKTLVQQKIYDQSLKSSLPAFIALHPVLLLAILPSMEDNSKPVSPSDFLWYHSEGDDRPMGPCSPNQARESSGQDAGLSAGPSGM